MKYSKRQPKSELKCPTCEDNFLAYAYEIRRGRIYCSGSCAGRARRGELAPWYGKKRDVATIEKMAQARRGKPSWNKGLVGVMPPPWNKGRKGYMSGELNVNWKGDAVAYRPLHSWVERQLGKPSQCQRCSKIASGHGMHWANKSGDYKREVSDWLRLCAKCHTAYDSNKMAGVF